jgi:hypothetical protein
VEIKKTVSYEQTVGHLCDVCGKNVNDDHRELYSREPAILYYENHTACMDYRCELCQDCFFKVVDFIRLIGGKVAERCWSKGGFDEV